MKILTAFTYLITALILMAPAFAAKQSKLYSVTREAVAKRTENSAIGGAISEREMEYKKRSAVSNPHLVNEAAREAIAVARKNAIAAGTLRCEQEFRICTEQKVEVVIDTESKVNIDSIETETKDADGFSQKLGVETIAVVRAKAKIMIQGTEPIPGLELSTNLDASDLAPSENALGATKKIKAPVGLEPAADKEISAQVEPKEWKSDSGNYPTVVTEEPIVPAESQSLEKAKMPKTKAMQELPANLPKKLPTDVKAI